MTNMPNVQSYKEGLELLLQQLGEMLPSDKLSVFDNDADRLATAYPSPLGVG